MDNSCIVSLMLQRNFKSDGFLAAELFHVNEFNIKNKNKKKMILKKKKNEKRKKEKRKMYHSSAILDSAKGLRA